MSFMRTLDEIPTSQLVHELVQRTRRFKAGRCPYCARPLHYRKDATPYCLCRFGDTETYHVAGSHRIIIPETS